MDLTKEFEKLQKGTHLCNVCGTSAEMVSTTVPFLLGGLVNNERCISIVSEDIKNALKDALAKRGINLERCLQWGQFIFLTHEETYLKRGYFDPEDAMQQFAQANQLALRDGFSGLRVTGEAHGILKGLSNIDHFFEYEAKVNILIKQSAMIAFCQYSETIFGKELLLKALYTHPTVIISGVLRDNPYYIPPEDFIKLAPERNSADKYDLFRSALLNAPPG